MSFNLEFDPGQMTKRLTFERLVITRERESAVRYYVPWKTKWGEIVEQSGATTEASATATATATVQVRVYFDPDFFDAGAKNLETIRFRIGTNVPVYLTDENGSVMYTLSGLPMIEEEQTYLQYYHLIPGQVNQYGSENRYLLLTAERVR
jgi:head-tail adaptor